LFAQKEFVLVLQDKQLIHKFNHQRRSRLQADVGAGEGEFKGARLVGMRDLSKCDALSIQYK